MSSSTRISERKGSTSRKQEEQKRQKAKVWLIIAVCWPFVVYLCAKMTGKRVIMKKGGINKLTALRGQVRSLLSRWETTGYGASKPRIAVVIVGNMLEGILKSVESVYQHTDRNRILTVVTVLDGITEEQCSEMQSKLDAIDQGLTAHSHHGFQHFHDLLEKAHKHAKKLHVICNATPRGVSDSRRDGVLFAQKLSEKYEANNLKSKTEDILLLLLRPDSTLTHMQWLDATTAALIAPPPIKLANAISFAVDYVDPETNQITAAAPGLSAAFDLSLNPYWAKAPDFNETTPSYTSPSLSGAATALRLQTFLDLPSFHTGLTTYFAADLDLALNLWLCADGIDVLVPARALIYPSLLPLDQTVVTDDLAARIAAAWLPSDISQAVYRARSAKNPISPQLWDKLLDLAFKSGDFPTDLDRKCRPFSYYASNVNPELQIKKSTNINNIIKLKTHVDKMPIKPKPDDKRALQQEIEKVKPPSIPLSDEKRLLSAPKLEILSHASPVDISFKKFPVGEEFPHMGAKDDKGKTGYIHDAAALKKDPPPYNFNENDCKSKDNHYLMLSNKVFVDHKAHDELTNPVKIFCIVYTIEQNHNRLPPIRETWAPKCDGFMVASNKTDPALGTVDISHEGAEVYNNIWQKVRAIWSYVYDNYYNDYDFFHIGGDDLYLIIENLRTYLSSDEIKAAANGGTLHGLKGTNTEKPLFLGRRFAEQGNKKRIFNSGGSGYTLNKAALKALIMKFPTCFPHLKTFAEDVMVAACFRQIGVFPFETRDDEGGERYMPFAPGHHLGYRPPAENPKKDWYVNYVVDTLKVGYDHCSAHSVAFHYIKSPMMRRMHAILYGYCDSK